MESSSTLVTDRSADAVMLGLGDACHDVTADRGIGGEQVLQGACRLNQRDWRGGWCRGLVLRL